MSQFPLTSGCRFAGIDLAADPARTGLAVLHQDGTGVRVAQVVVGVEDAAIVTVVADSSRSGVDVPMGWPDSFVELVGQHSAGVLVPPESTGIEWRREHVLRATDTVLTQRLGLHPLSVAADRIAHPALRWAGIEARMRGEGLELRRDGSGLVAEVYPAGALASWGLLYRGYKGADRTDRRIEIMAALSELLPWLDWGDHWQRCAEDDNALDAVLAALVAREVHRGNHHPPPESLRARALREGWICVPKSVPSS